MLTTTTEADSGLIINTCGWIDGVGYELLQHAINAFHAGMCHACKCASTRVV